MLFVVDFNHDADAKAQQQKRRMPPALLTEEQKQIVAEEMNEANLGPICSVCGKVFKTKDALDFHIMYTKLPGHDVLLQQKVRNNYAEEAMRVSAKLQMDSHIPTDYGPPTPIVNFDEPPTPAGSMPEEVFDAKTGIFVKPEAEPETLGMISHKKSLLTIFGQKHEIKKFHQKI